MLPSLHRTRKPCDCVRQSCDDELARALELLRAGAAPEAVVETLSQRLTKRLLHLPTKLISEAI